MAVKQTFTSRAQELLTDLDKMNKLLGTQVKKFEEISPAAQRMERSVEKAFEQRKDGDKFVRTLKDLKAQLKAGTITQDQYTAAVRRTLRVMKETDKAQRNAFGPRALQQVKSLAGGLAGGAGVLAAVSKVNQAYETWIENTREISEESRKAQNEIIAFAALQEGGTKAARVMQAATLAAEYGISDRAQAFNTVQALQSAPGSSFQQGLEASRAVFAGTQLGISVEAGTELEVLGASQGQGPGDAIRRAYIAGQESSRDPEVIARGASGLKKFDDKDFGFAVAAVLAGGDSKEKLNVLVQRAGTALSATGSAQDSFEKLGLGNATRKQKLQKLAELGIDTAVELEQFGFKEIRAINALETLVPNISRVLEIEKKVKSDNSPGLLSAARAEVENELPNQKLSRQIATAEVTFSNELAFGDGSSQALQLELNQRARGLAFQRLGKTQTVFGGDLIDAEGRSTAKQSGALFLQELLTPNLLTPILPPGISSFVGVERLRRQVNVETEKARSEFGSGDSKELTQALRENTVAIREMNVNQRGGQDDGTESVIDKLGEIAENTSPRLVSPQAQAE